MADLSQLEVFVRVVDHASFTAAAEAMGVSKSFASRQVSALEDRLGARLLNRTTRRVTLTDVGRVFHDRCRRILEELEDAETAVSSLQNAPRGTLRIAAPVTFGVRYITPLIADFMCEHTELDVEVEFNDRRVDLVDDGFDLAIRIGLLDDSALIARKLAPTTSYIFASPKYLEEHGEPRTPEELRSHQCLRYAYQSRGLSWSLQGPEQRELSVVVRGRAVLNSGEALVEFGRRGLGLVWSPDFLAVDAVRAGHLVRVLPGWRSKSHVWAVYPHSRHLSAKVRLFVERLIAWFSAPDWRLESDEDNA